VRTLTGPPRGAERRRLREGLAQPPERAARFLLGQILVRRGRRSLTSRIVETEAYLGEGDPAAHSFRGPTPRTRPLWGPPGTVYVYFIYGMHHCLNVAVDREGAPGCVLIRAAEPLEDGAETSLTGPGRLCRALGLDVRDSGSDLFAPGSRLYLREGTPPRRVTVATRVGIRRAADRPLRFYDAHSAAVSAARGVEVDSKARLAPRKGRPE
jgi:DNA-3-methyladenine glycosylase